MRRIARPGLRMLDIGANLGLDTLCAARAAGGDARIWSFEPTPEVAAMLERSAGLNGFAGVTVQRLALGDRNGEIGFQRGEFSALNRVGGGGATVPMARLDDAAARLEALGGRSTRWWSTRRCSCRRARRSIRSGSTFSPASLSVRRVSRPTGWSRALPDRPRSPTPRRC